MTLLHNVLREYRKNRGKTQEEMAKLLNISQQAYANYETGKREPDIKTLIQLADYYQISLDILTGRYSINTDIKK